MPPDEAHELCQKIAMKALELDSMLPQAHLIKGVNHVYDFDWEKADREFQQALMLGPEEPDVLGFHAMMYLLPLGRLEGLVFGTRSSRVMEIDVVTPWASERPVSGCTQILPHRMPQSPTSRFFLQVFPAACVDGTRERQSACSRSCKYSGVRPLIRTA